MGALIPFVLAIALGLGVGFGGGALLMGGAQNESAPAPERPEPAMPLAEVPRAEATVDLPPIVTNLAGADGAWARLELSLAFAESADAGLADRVRMDALAFLRTLTVKQIASPSGFHFLRNDLADRARDLTDGAVTGVLIRTFLIE